MEENLPISPVLDDLVHEPTPDQPILPVSSPVPIHSVEGMHFAERKEAVKPETVKDPGRFRFV